jgi:probable rRNA maturation factor
MADNYDVLVSIDPRFERLVSADWIVGIVQLALETEGHVPCQISVVLTDDEQVRALNRDYADDDHATDVLSFSLVEGEEFASPDEVIRLGEVIVSMETADRQARAAGIDVDAEVAHLLVHGVLHLLGHDHLEPDQEASMREREGTILAQAGLSAH